MPNSLDKINELEKRDKELLSKMEQWEKSYKHRKPCKRYADTGFCIHLVMAQNKKFGTESRSLFSNFAELTRETI